MKINTLHAEQHHLGELPAGLQPDWTEAEAQASHTELAAADEAYLARYPADKAAAAIQAALAAPSPQARSQRPSRLTRLTLRFAPLLAAAALIVGIGTGPLLDSLNTERTKGSAANGGAKLAVYRQSADGVTLLAEGAKARAGDRLQVEFVAPLRSWVLVFSVDGAGVLTTHYPADSAASKATRAVQVATADTLVNQAYVLDNAPNFERFYLVVAAHGFDLATVWSSLRAHPLDTRLPDGLIAYPLTLTKEP
ncbi:MAG: hypothetical protein WCG80_19165 [Spirochaetales bacterium]